MSSKSKRPPHKPVSLNKELYPAEKEDKDEH